MVFKIGEKSKKLIGTFDNIINIHVYFFSLPLYVRYIYNIYTCNIYSLIFQELLDLSVLSVLILNFIKSY